MSIYLDDFLKYMGTDKKFRMTDEKDIERTYKWDGKTLCSLSPAGKIECKLWSMDYLGKMSNLYEYFPVVKFKFSTLDNDFAGVLLEEGYKFIGVDVNGYKHGYAEKPYWNGYDFSCPGAGKSINLTHFSRFKSLSRGELLNLRDGNITQFEVKE